MKPYLYEPAKPLVAKDGKLFVYGPRVVTTVKSKEYFVHYRTFHSNKEIQTLYEEFKLCESPLSWLRDNKKRIEKFNINISGIVEKMEW